MRTGLLEVRRLLRALISLVAHSITVSRPVVANAGREVASSTKRICSRAWVAGLTWSRRWAWPRMVAVTLTVRREFPVVLAAIARITVHAAQTTKRTGRATFRSLVAASRWTYARARSAYNVAWAATTSVVGRAAIAIWHGGVRASAAVTAGWSILCTVSVKAGRTAVAFARALGVAVLRAWRVVAAFAVLAGRAGTRQTLAALRRTRIWAQHVRGGRLPANLRGRLRPDRSWAHPFAALFDSPTRTRLAPGAGLVEVQPLASPLCRCSVLHPR